MDQRPRALQGSTYHPAIAGLEDFAPVSPPFASKAVDCDSNAAAIARPSLPEVHRSIAVPTGDGRFWTKLGAFAGPGYLVAVGYMDPGNWATDIAGGSSFGYSLLSVILISNLMSRRSFRGPGAPPP